MTIDCICEGKTCLTSEQVGEVIAKIAKIEKTVGGFSPFRVPEQKLALLAMARANLVQAIQHLESIKTI